MHEKKTDIPEMTTTKQRCEETERELKLRPCYVLMYTGAEEGCRIHDVVMVVLDCACQLTRKVTDESHHSNHTQNTSHVHE